MTEPTPDLDLTAPQRFRKKPVVIEAMRLPEKDSPTEMTRVAEWCGGWVGGGTLRTHILIPTLEGVMRGDRGDWIIRGVKGEFYPCKPDIFDATYEAVNDD